MAGPPVSEIVSRRPAPPLRPFVTWYCGYRDADVGPRRHRGLPSPYLTVIIALYEPLVVAAHPDPRVPPAEYGTLVGGLHTAPVLITHDGRQSGIQLSLSPLGARALLGLPAGELTGSVVDAADVMGPFANRLRERVLEAPGWTAMFTVLDEMLSAHLDAGARLQSEVVRAWQRLLTSAGAVPAAELAREVGWSGRYLSRRFGVEVGLSPKAAARVVRFDRVRRLLMRRAAEDQGLLLSDVAAACGYYDQAHLAREFGEFAGCSPSRWLGEEFRYVQAGTGTPVPHSAS
ncbi:helix-turn-helix domain-containing protein [Planotetraspora kaengkrachanensis]|uniref:AraC family transcriptional regulator n=1 Tax=Planotetraspora kaengkrachanensis TaxID=575193 RepID=A0A8J3Q171_9ACTN|nr:helix-turn-helix domain-containing protein [Planotetraspora kaengkrachanensis]GIG84636.1 AraC family transcriptional regulator [Planotetraspora kaengkrachanensis]